MRVGDTTRLESLERLSPELFLAAGCLAAGHAVIAGVRAVTELATLPDVFAPAGGLVALLGLCGVAVALADRAPWLARAGAACAALGAVGFATITAGTLAEVGGVEPPGWVAAFTLPAVVGMVPGFLAAGAASLRAGVHARTVGLVLLTPGVVFLGILAAVTLFGTSALAGLLGGGGLALSHLSIGYALRTGDDPADRASPAGDATAG